MEHKIAKDKCLDWIAGSLSTEERRIVQQHLDECGECRTYFERVSLLVESPHTTLLPHLTPDPFLPSRIRALAEERRAAARDRRSAVGWVRVSAAGAMLILAAAAGIYLGNGFYANTRSAEDVELADAYYEAFSPSDFSGVWEDLLAAAGTDGQPTNGQQKEAR
jgi:predicted anti-sigma-YlaC factor YlaD